MAFVWARLKDELDVEDGEKSAAPLLAPGMRWPTSIAGVHIDGWGVLKCIMLPLPRFRSLSETAARRSNLPILTHTAECDLLSTVSHVLGAWIKEICNVT